MDRSHSGLFNSTENDYAVTTLILNRCAEMDFRKLRHNNMYISTLREVVISPKSITSRQPNHSLRIRTTVALASISFPLTNTWVFSINLLGSTITLTLMVFSVFTTLALGNSRWI